LNKVDDAPIEALILIRDAMSKMVEASDWLSGQMNTPSLPKGGRIWCKEEA
jgi:hypothetical protein